MTDWTDERVKTLRQMIEDSHSAAEIAAHFGITRSAVIGKSHRTGITWPDRPGLPKAARDRRIRIRRASMRLVKPAKPIIGGNVSLYDLKAEQCHFPNEGKYCGQPNMPGTAYCAWHYKLMHAETKRA